MTTETEKLKPVEWIERVLKSKAGLYDQKTASKDVKYYAFLIDAEAYDALRKSLDTPVDWSEDK